jgi:DNA replication protein DnaC
VYYSIVILTILYYLRVADLMGITSSYPRENIIAGNYILADMSDAVMHKAKSYVDNWEETKRNHIGCLFWGPVGTWKSFIAGCIANELLKQEVTVKMSNFNTIIDDRGTGGTISFY